MKEWDPSGKVGPRTPLPDVVTVLNPKEEELPYENIKGKVEKEGFQGKQIEVAYQEQTAALAV
jgi:hypothetical protein